MIRTCKTCRQYFQPSRPHHYQCWDCWKRENPRTTTQAASDWYRVGYLAGHEAGYDAGQRAARPADRPALDGDFLMRVIQLTHPDRHPEERQDQANAVTARLLELREAVTR